MEPLSWMLVRIVSLKNLQKTVIKLSESRGESRTYTCGRAKAMDLCCESHLISRSHCIFFLNANKIYVQDLGSLNGTFVDGKMQNPHDIVEIKENSIVSLGTSDLTTNHAEKFIFRVEKEVMSIGNGNSIPKEQNRNSEENRLKTAGSSQDESDDEIQILAEFFPNRVTQTFTEQRNIKINFELEFSGNNVPKVYVNMRSPDLSPFSNILTIAGRSIEEHQAVIPLENHQREIFSEEIDITESTATIATENNNTECILQSEASNEEDSSNLISNSVQIKGPSRNRILQNEEKRLKTISPIVIEDKRDSKMAENEESKVKIKENQNKRNNIRSIRVLPNEEVSVSKFAQIKEASRNFVMQNEKQCSLTGLASPSASASISPLIFSSSVSSLDINKENTREIRNCSVPGNILQIEEPPMKMSRIDIKKKEARKGLVDYEIDESSYSESDVEDSHVISTPVQKTDFNLLELSQNLVSIEKETPVSSHRIFESEADEADLVLKEWTPIPSHRIYASEAMADKALMEILSWNPVEFLMAENCSRCTPCELYYNKFFNYTSKFYNEYENYSSALISFLLLDIACGIKSEFSAIEKNPFFTECVIVKDSATKFQIGEADSFLLSFKIKILCSEKNILKVPMIGDVLSIDLISGSNNSFTIMFAFVSEVSIATEDDATQMTCTVFTKMLDFNIYNSHIQVVRIIIGALVALNLVKALEEVQTSPLLPLILRPTPKIFSFNESSKSSVLKSFQYQSLQKNLDYDQLTAVLKITKVIHSEEPKVCVIAGPPGTGKTNVTTNIILRALCSQKADSLEQKPLKILVTCGSKAEIDEILIRLSSEEKRLGMSHKLVRVGNSNKAQIQAYTLRNLAEKFVKDHQLDSDIGILDPDPLEFSRNLEFGEKLLLSQADVIFCTLSMCLSDRMCSAFGQKNPISVCLVDEAAQVNEIEILQPLTFGVKTLVLFGDPHKISIRNISLTEKFNSTSYMTSSLFLRLMSNFNETNESPVINLERQYRMNEKVFYLINKYFHNETLETKEKEPKKFPLFSCSIFSINSLKSHKVEVTFAKNLIFCILHGMTLNDFTNFGKPISIGIVVPYCSSKKYLQAEIENWISLISMEKREYFTIEVDTISAFKNQERDILIISCVNKNKSLLTLSGEYWLYSSMSKVKHSLIIYGVNETFQVTQKECMWNAFVTYLKDKRILINIKDPSSLKELQKILLRKR